MNLNSEVVLRPECGRPRPQQPEAGTSAQDFPRLDCPEVSAAEDDRTPAAKLTSALGMNEVSHRSGGGAAGPRPPAGGPPAPPRPPPPPPPRAPIEHPPPPHNRPPPRVLFGGPPGRPRPPPAPRRRHLCRPAQGERTARPRLLTHYHTAGTRAKHPGWKPAATPPDATIPAATTFAHDHSHR